MSEALELTHRGTYDDGNGMTESIMRVKAIQLTLLRYQLLVRQAQGCGCARCAAEQARRLETEP